MRISRVRVCVIVNFSLIFIIFTLNGYRKQEYSDATTYKDNVPETDLTSGKYERAFSETFEYDACSTSEGIYYKYEMRDIPFNQMLNDKCSNDESHIVTYSRTYGNVDNRTRHFVTGAFGKMDKNLKCNVTKYVDNVLWSRDVTVLTTCAYKETATKYLVSIIVHLAENRIGNIHKIIHYWAGPLIVVVEVERNHVCDVYKQMYKLLDNPNIVFLLVAKRSDFYPINWMRNMGQQHAITDYILHIDADFMPSPNLHHSLQYNTSFTYNGEPVAMVIPAFETLAKNVSVPVDKPDLLGVKRPIQPFHVNFWSCGHGKTNYAKWKQTNSAYEIRYSENDCLSCYEPYFVIHKDYAPWYPEILLHRFFNKIPGFGQLCLKKFRVFVHPDGFLIHLYHYRDIKLDHIGYDDKFPCINWFWEKYKKLMTQS